MQRIFTMPFHVPGALSANINIRFKAPCDCQLLHVSAGQSDTDTAVLDIGPSTDTDGYLDGVNFGVSNVALVYGRTDFVGDQYPHIAAGTIVVITITDHASHSNDPTVVLTFAEG
ncbi:MAG: hypothetical protein EHM35_06105 [Planctomycetaceae bacterium]|nr:MAG: hypothetical protein EHM35_06105 [Planctomycetaceae bacterium]